MEGILPREGVDIQKSWWDHIGLDKIQVSTNEEPKVGPNIQFELEKDIEEIEIP